MKTGKDKQRRRRYSILGLFLDSLRRHVRELPISFYLMLAIVLALLLGASGFEDLENPKRMAFTLTLFTVFFAVVAYRAIVDAMGIARRFYRENNGVFHHVFSRDDFSAQLGDRVAERESKPGNEEP